MTACGSYEGAFQQEAGQGIPNTPHAKLIEQAYLKGMNEIDKKQAQQAFYAANARVFLQTCNVAAGAIAKAQPDPRRDVFASQHYSLLRNMAPDAQALLADWATSMQGISAAESAEAKRRSDCEVPRTPRALSVAGLLSRSEVQASPTSGEGTLARGGFAELP